MIILVAGPPCSGKSTWVKYHAAGDRDLVIDFDDLLSAITANDTHELGPGDANRAIFIPFVCEARDAILRRLRRRSGIQNVYVITFGARVSDRAKFNAGVVHVFDVPAEECKRRAIESGRPESTLAEIDRWWAQYLPDMRSRKW